MAETLNPTNWAAIAGRWSITANQVVYLGPDEGAPSPLGICVTNIEIKGGRISCRTMLSDSEVEGKILLGYRTPIEKYIMAGLRGWRSAYSIGEWDPSLGWRGRAIAGSDQNLVSGQWYTQTVDLIGQRLRVTVDSVPVLRYVLPTPMAKGQVGLFAFGKNRVEFENFTVTKEEPTAFVVMKFGEPYQQLYEEVIKPVVQENGLRAYHVGEVFGPGLILKDIVKGIVEAEVVIAEITPVNQNVFYELGYAHALDKPTILLAEREAPLPFDVSGYRVLKYDNTIAGKRLVEEGLRKHLTAILQE